MMNARKHIAMAMGVAVIISSIWLGTGCESISETVPIVLIPTGLTISNEMVVLYSVTGDVSSLVLPLEWSVSDSTLGEIIDGSVVQAVYVRNGYSVGINVIRVKDQANGEGLIAIEQNPPSASILFGLEIEPADTDIDDTPQSVALEVTDDGSVSPPLVWSVSNPERGSISGSSGLRAVYQNTEGALGVNTITVRDQRGAEGVAAVTARETVVEEEDE